MVPKDYTLYWLSDKKSDNFACNTKCNTLQISWDS